MAKQQPGGDRQTIEDAAVKGVESLVSDIGGKIKASESANNVFQTLTTLGIVEAVKAKIQHYLGTESVDAKGVVGIVKDRVQDKLSDRAEYKASSEGQAATTLAARATSKLPDAVQEKISDHAEFKATAEKGALSAKDAAKDLGGKLKGLNLDGAKGIAGEALGALKTGDIKQKGAVVGGAAVAADGFRRMVKKGDDGKRHVVRGAVQAGVGIGAATAAVLNQRSKAAGQDQSPSK